MGSISRRSGESQYRIESQHVSPACPPIEDRDLRVDPSLVPTPTLDATRGRSEERTPGREERTAAKDEARADKEKERRELGDGSRSLVSGGGAALGIYGYSPAIPVQDDFSSSEFTYCEPHDVRVYSDEEKAEYAARKRAQNYARAQVARKWIADDYYASHGPEGRPASICRCGHALKSGAGAVELDSEGRVIYSRQRCKSWACPSCAYARSLERADEIERALVAAFRKGWRVLFITFTIPHDSSQSCRTVIDNINAAFNAFPDYRQYRELRAPFGYEGNIKSMDFTFTKNGCHAHLHCLYFFSYAGDVFDIYQAYRLKLPAIWNSAVQRYTNREISFQHGVDIEPVRMPDSSDDAPTLAAYVAKVVSVYAANPDKDKGSVTPFDLLDDPNDESNRALFLDWYHGTFKGKRLRFSSGLKKRLEMDDSDFTSSPSVVLGGLSPRATVFLLDPDNLSRFRSLLLSESPVSAAYWLDRESGSPSHWHDDVLLDLSSVSFDELSSWISSRSTPDPVGDIVLDASQEVSSLFVA